MLQQCQRFAELSTGESGLDSERTPGFREFFAAVGLQDEGQVAVAGGGKLEGFLQLNLPCGALQKISAAHHIGDALRRVVNDYGELICKRTIAAANNRIA